MTTNPTTKNRRDFIDIYAAGTARGKTLTARAIQAHCRAAGVEPVVFRFESAATAGTRPNGEVLINSDKLVDPLRDPGGAISILDPIGKAITDSNVITDSKGTPVILDWPGGQSALRGNFYVASAFDSLAEEKGFVGWSFVVTTNQAASMVQAADALDETAKVAPRLRRVLVLNSLHGGFDQFPPGSAEGRAYADALMPRAAKCAANLTLPLIAWNGWEPFSAANLSILDVLNRPVGELADITGLSPMLAATCRTSVAAWFAEVEPQLERLLPLR
jgi:hypothetical protein